MKRSEFLLRAALALPGVALLRRLLPERRPNLRDVDVSASWHQLPGEDEVSAELAEEAADGWLQEPTHVEVQELSRGRPVRNYRVRLRPDGQWSVQEPLPDTDGLAVRYAVHKGE